MSEETSAQLAQRAMKVRLLTLEQFEELRHEGTLELPADEFLRLLERRGTLTPYQSHKLSKGDTDLYYLGNYKILYKVGSGTYGRVFRAEDPTTGAVVALKVLRRKWNEKTHNIEQFEKEAKVGISLRHPNIVSILFMGKDPASQQYFFAMEFVEGGDLRDILNIRKKLEPAEALRFIEDCAAGLAFAYSRGVTHRDMKLSNILISAQGVAKLVDFGLAGRATLPGIGDDKADRSVDYAGLEMATNVPPGDVRSDIYFMGCVLYEILTGRSPLVMSKDKQARMQKERFERVPPMTREEVNAPHAVFQLVETMMSLSPHRRYQNPSQLLGAIRAARVEVEANPALIGGPGSAQAVAAPVEERTIFVIEKNERLQELLRDKLKKDGYRVLMSINPDNAVNRFRSRPFEGIIMDLETVGGEAMADFVTIMKEAVRQKVECAGILVLGEDQDHLAKKVQEYPKVAIMQRPLSSKQLMQKLREMVPPPGNHQKETAESAGN